MPDTPNAENRVYLFRELAAAFVSAESKQLGSADTKKRSQARQALAELARVSSLVAGEDAAAAEELYDRVRDDVVKRRKREDKGVRSERRAAKKEERAKPKKARAKPKAEADKATRKRRSAAEKAAG